MTLAGFDQDAPPVLDFARQVSQQLNPEAPLLEYKLTMLERIVRGRA